MAAVLAPENIPSESTALIQVIERAAANPDVDIDKMERLMLMHERIMQRNGETLFNESLSACQSEMRPIAADAENPQTRSEYATYAALDRALRPIYTKHGFAISYNTADSPKPEHVRVLAYVSKSSFTRTYHVDMPADGKGAKGGDVMTKTHASGAANSYGMRYLLKMVFNVAIGEDDTDGNAPLDVDPPPQGYDRWKADMTACADEGIAKLQEAWKKSANGYRQWATMNDAQWWAKTKTKAQGVQS